MLRLRQARVKTGRSGERANISDEGARRGNPEAAGSGKNRNHDAGELRGAHKTIWQENNESGQVCVLRE